MLMTVHGIPKDGHWTVKREGGKAGRVFPTQREAVKSATVIARELSPYEVPTERVEVGGKDARRVKTLAGEVLPARLWQDLGVNLTFPEDRERLSLGVIFQAGKINKRLFGITRL